MLCERCHEREANIVIKEVVNGVVHEHNLCSACAQETELAQLFDDFPFGKLLSGILGLNGDDQTEEKENYNQIVCPTCGMSYGEFVRDSQFGCPDCYDTFSILMSSNIKKLQGSDTHVGKHPRYQTETQTEDGSAAGAPQETMEDRLAVLRSRLQEAISEEEYEEAARYRDEIRKLQGEGVDA